MRISTLIIFIALLATNSCFAQPIVLPAAEELQVSKGLLSLADSAKSVQLKDVLAGSYKSKFRTVDDEDLKEGTDVYWLRFSVKNATEYDQEWIFDFENWSFVDFYYEKSTQFLLKKTGHLYPYRKRDYPVANKSYIKLLVKSGETKECIVRLEYQLSISKTPQNLHFKVTPKELIDKENATVGKVIFVFLGIFAVMFLYNLFVFFVTRLKSYGYYLLVLISAFSAASLNSGYIVSLFGAIDSFPFWVSKYELIDSELASVAYLLFVQSLLHTRERYPKWHKTANILIISNIVIGLLFFVFVEIAFVLLLLVTIVIFAFLLLLGIKCIKDKIPSAGYFLLGYLASISGVVCMILVLTGILPKNDFTYNYSIPLGLTIEIVLFSFALANMINVLRKDNEEKQKRNIDQLLENQQLQTKVNRELEQKVKERTAELNVSLNRLRATQDQLILREKLVSLGELTAGIAHEIQNPLNFVNNFSELSMELAQELKEEIEKPQVDKELISDLVGDLTQNQQKINQHGQRASKIVKGMLEHSRVGAGERQMTNLNSLANEYLQIAYHGFKAGEKSFTVEMITDPDPNLIEIEIVPQDMGRVLLNLYNNAFYAMHEKTRQGQEDYKPTVWVSTRLEQGKVELRVKDNGMGIPKGNLSKIFQPFFTTKATGEGTGLGLSISYDIVTKGHGGEIIAKSEVGNYTEFLVRLPY